MRGCAVGIVVMIFGLGLAGCVAPAGPTASHAPSASPLPPAGGTDPSALVCRLPHEVQLSLRGDQALVNGEAIETLELLSEKPDPYAYHAPHPLVSLFGPCAKEQHQIHIEIERRAPAWQLGDLLNEAQLRAGHSAEIRFGGAQPVSVTLVPPGPIMRHWVRVAFHSDRVDAFELKREPDRDEAAPDVVRQVHAKDLSVVLAFVRNACNTSACQGVILMFPTSGDSSQMEPVLRAAGASNAKPILLALRAVDWASDSNEFVTGGRLDPEVIQRVVRENYGAFKSCYEAGLQRNPNLAGSVRTRFVIELDGSVKFSASQDSNLPDHGVEACVVESFKRLHFPHPRGGVVTVVYPVMLSP